MTALLAILILSELLIMVGIDRHSRHRPAFQRGGQDRAKCTCRSAYGR
jgi:hypothetical protein